MVPVCYIPILQHMGAVGDGIVALLQGLRT
jgi:hypothetical protein